MGGVSALVNFTLAHGFVPSTPAVDMAQVLHRSLQSALDDCAAVPPCAAVSFRVGDAQDAKPGAEARWYAFKRYPPGGAALPSVWPDAAWTTYVRTGARPAAAPRACATHECAGVQAPCGPSRPPEWGWLYRAAPASAVPRRLGFAHAGGRGALQVHWHDAHSLLDFKMLTLLPGTRQEVLGFSGAVWRVRTPPPDSRLVAEHLGGRGLVQNCACGALLTSYGLVHARPADGAEGGPEAGPALRLEELDAVANAELQAAHAGEEEGGEGAGAGGSPLACARADAAAPPAEQAHQLELHLFNASPFDARLVRARLVGAPAPRGDNRSAAAPADAGGAARFALCDAGPLGSGLDTLLTDLRLGDLVLACAVRSLGSEASCAQPLLVRRLADVALRDCAAGGQESEWSGAAAGGGDEGGGPQAAAAGAGAARAAELRRLEAEGAELAELLRSAEAALEAAERFG